jgi:hypothetical protein
MGRSQHQPRDTTPNKLGEFVQGDIRGEFPESELPPIMGIDGISRSQPQLYHIAKHEEREWYLAMEVTLCERR